MPFADTFLPEFDNEMKTTRALLERVPFDKAEWKPHTKSTALGALASHVAGLARFGTMIAGHDELDIAAPGRAKPPQHSNTPDLLGAFDDNVKTTREAIATMTEADLLGPWTLKAGSHTVFTMPRAAALRTMMLNHMIHHRGQLSVYLRLNDVPLPSIYGPTADT